MNTFTSIHINTSEIVLMILIKKIFVSSSIPIRKELAMKVGVWN